MTYLLIGNSFERKELIIKIIFQYFKEQYTIDEIHYLLDLIINDTLRLEEGLFEKDFYKLCEKFKDEFIDYYNDLPEIDIDILPSNYVLKDEFVKGLKEFYEKLNNL